MLILKKLNKITFVIYILSIVNLLLTRVIIQQNIATSYLLKIITFALISSLYREPLSNLLCIVEFILHSLLITLVLKPAVFTMVFPRRWHH